MSVKSMFSQMSLEAGQRVYLVQVRPTVQFLSLHPYEVQEVGRYVVVDGRRFRRSDGWGVRTAGIYGNEYVRIAPNQVAAGEFAQGQLSLVQARVEAFGVGGKSQYGFVPNDDWFFYLPDVGASAVVNVQKLHLVLDAFEVLVGLREKYSEFVAELEAGV